MGPGHARARHRLGHDVLRRLVLAASCARRTCRWSATRPAAPAAPTAPTFDPETMVCAGDPPGTAFPRDTCQGDSGGPLYVPDFGSTPADPIFATAGVVSWGFGCADTAVPWHLHPHRRGRAQRLDARPHPAGELRSRPRRGRHAARDAALDLDAPGRPERLQHLQVGLRPGRPVRRRDRAEPRRQTFPAPGQRVIGLEASGPRATWRASTAPSTSRAAPVVTPPPTGGGDDPAAVRRRTVPAAQRWSPASRRSSRPRA